MLSGWNTYTITLCYQSKFYRPLMIVDIQRHYSECIARLQAKTTIISHGLYTPLIIASALWEDMCVDFF